MSTISDRLRRPGQGCHRTAARVRVPGHEDAASGSEEARRALPGQVTEWFDEGRETFQTADVSKVWTAAGRTRQWAQNRLRELKPDGVLGYNDAEQCFTVLDRPHIMASPIAPPLHSGVAPIVRLPVRRPRLHPDRGGKGAP